MTKPRCRYGMVRVDASHPDQLKRVAEIDIEKEIPESPQRKLQPNDEESANPQH